ncbi:MAG: substrate-binding domain-containing protein, partial [Planctomycetia bacterium]|nr:substrate-binding domain-containing protein [Planctomycetia bacterium]
RGTFVTEKVLECPSSGNKKTIPSSTPFLRLAIMSLHCRYSRVWSKQSAFFEIGSGFTEAAAEEAISLEYLGDNTLDREILQRRFEKNPPSVLICLGNPAFHLTAIGEAQQHQIPILLAGIRTPDYDFPCIAEESVGATRMGVRKLYELGHRRIALVQAMGTGGEWVFDRYRGYCLGMRQCGLDTFSRLVYWMEPTWTGGEAGLMEFFHREKPTAAIFGSLLISTRLPRCIQGFGLRIPEDLSILAFDDDRMLDSLGNLQLATIQLPHRRIGRLLAEYGKKLACGESVPKETLLPCTFGEGNSLRTY